MLSSNLQSILDNRLRYLPEITGKAINSFDWSSKLIDIGKKFGLHIDDMEDFQAVVLKSMIGMIPPEKFEDELITALAISPATAVQVINEVNDQIFEPVHEFVLNKGAAPDPLKSTGIIVEQPAFEPVTEEVVPQPKAVASAPLEIPPSPEPVKPNVPGNFNDFFVDPVVK